MAAHVMYDVVNQRLMAGNHRALHLEVNGEAAMTEAAACDEKSATVVFARVSYHAILLCQLRADETIKREAIATRVAHQWHASISSRRKRADHCFLL